MKEEFCNICKKDLSQMRGNVAIFHLRKCVADKERREWDKEMEIKQQRLFDEAWERHYGEKRKR